MTRVIPVPASVFAVLAVLLPPLGLYAPRALVIAGGIAALLLLPHRAVRTALVADLRRPLSLVMLAGLVWAGLAIAWAPDAGRAVRLWLSLIAISLGGKLLLTGARQIDDAGRRQVENALMAGGLYFLLLALIEGATGGVVLRLLRGDIAVEALSRGSAVFAVLLPLFALVFARRLGGRAALAVVALGLVALLLLPMFAAFVAGGAGVFAALVVGVAPRAGGWALAVGAGLLILLAPPLAMTLADPALVQAALPGLPTNFLHRFDIWSFTGARIVDRPVLGWGLDAARALPGGERMAGLQSVLPLHPHNTALQVWVELGAVGALLATGLWLTLCRWIGHAGWPRAVVAATAAMMAAWFIIAHLSFGIWQNWWLVLPWLAAALFTAVVPVQNGSTLFHEMGPGDTK